MSTDTSYGIVTARVVRAVAKADGLELVPAAGRISFRAPKGAPPRRILVGGVAFVQSETVRCQLADGREGSGYPPGTLLGLDGAPGVPLATGVWHVEFELSDGVIRSFPIQVTAAHTRANPLDLMTVAPYEPEPGSPVVPVMLPTGAGEGDILCWVGGRLMWRPAPPAGVTVERVDELIGVALAPYVDGEGVSALIGEGVGDLAAKVTAELDLVRGRFGDYWTGVEVEAHVAEVVAPLAVASVVDGRIADLEAGVDEQISAVQSGVDARIQAVDARVDATNALMDERLGDIETILEEVLS